MGIKVIKLDDQKGIVRCNHLEKDNTIRLLNSFDKINIETVATSGTIKSLIRKYL